ncbi:hypothetical protein SAMN05444355_1025 [Flavobacterium frigoris]|uniref:Uncharacterized protein n=1 Tax=Flavobacterium frigoris TaxID=229204 RepID=A0A1H9EUX7_FLAFI|nr:hypothetical protein SAMN05444355_1025 [Flavobacterium frigoris]
MLDLVGKTKIEEVGEGVFLAFGKDNLIWKRFLYFFEAIPAVRYIFLVSF